MVLQFAALPVLALASCIVSATPASDPNSLDEDLQAMRVELVQSDVRFARQRHSRAQAMVIGADGSTVTRDAPEQQAELAKLKRMYWVHVAKAGTTFANVLIKHWDICPGLTKDEVLTSDLWKQPNHNSIFFEYSSEAKCPGAFVRGYGFASHQGLADLTDDEREGHGVIMLRQPEQRLMSSFYDGQHDWPKEEPPATSVLQYAESVVGCVVKMLTRGGGTEREPCSEMGPPTDGELAQAAYRLKRDFAFVGLTEEWDLSVCLFHAKFGGECHDYELSDVNPGHRRANTTELYDTEDLEGLVDTYDGQLYSLAQDMFTRAAAQYGVTARSCETTCRAGAP